MLVKNLKTGHTWAVTEKYGAALLRTGEFEKVEGAALVKHVPFTELPAYEKVTAKQLKAELAHREITFDAKAEKQEIYDLLKAEFEKVGD